ncbi:class I SAM-dependent methyltransferase [Rhodanobacter umsongensis]|uniref:Class I SAM-dependent methyltransferase n=1 Tax=Rhodanobacter umsongensis TaxID=633153 RepID=A0ABW0JQK2_9GAMM
MNTGSATSEMKEISRCRISGSTHLVSVLNLGQQSLTGVFPRDPTQAVTCGPLELVWCPDSGLLQLKHSYSLSEMYGDNYGYRSGLNSSMVAHLNGKVRGLERQHRLVSGDWVLDIGSNDGTLLKAYAASGIHRVGMDPTAGKFRDFYPPEVEVVTDFFDGDRFLRASHGHLAKIITSIAMFYDLEDPSAFVGDIARALAPDGVWHFEQSYMPSMLRTNAYDTVCHEHLEFYSLRVIRDLLARHALRIVDVQMNSVNGGSIAVTACHEKADIPSARPIIDWMLQQEDNWGLNSVKPYRQFEDRVFKHRADLQRLIQTLVADGKLILGYGASTKGNVLLQFCQFGPQQIPAIAEVNAEKFGAYTPGTLIPIISEEDARAMRPDYFLVLPWHFKSTIVQREKEYLASGGKLIFPLPEIEIVGD